MGLWVGFNLFVLEAAAWRVVWLALALLFGAGVWTFMGPEPGLEYYTGYLIEKALSVDNIFVFVLIFSYFGVPPRTSTGCCSGGSSGRSSCAVP